MERQLKLFEPEETEEDFVVVNKTENLCHCPNLLDGHHLGCDYLKNQRIEQNLPIYPSVIPVSGSKFIKSFDVTNLPRHPGFYSCGYSKYLDVWEYRFPEF